MLMLELTSVKSQNPLMTNDHKYTIFNHNCVNHNFAYIQLQQNHQGVLSSLISLKQSIPKDTRYNHRQCIILKTTPILNSSNTFCMACVNDFWC